MLVTPAFTCYHHNNKTNTKRVDTMIDKISFPIKPKFCPGQDTTPNAGSLPFLKILSDHGILHRLPGERLRSQGWLDGQMVLAIMLLNILGFDRVSDIDQLEDDRVLCRMVSEIEPRLFGHRKRTLDRRHRGGRERTFPSPRSIHDWLERYHDDAAGKERVKAEAYIPPPSRALQKLQQINRVMIARQVRQKDLNHLTIDIDATIIPSGKRECLATYRSANGMVPFEKGYQPLMGYSPELGMILHVEMRDGNVPAGTGNCRFLDEILHMLPGEVASVAVRMDSAGYQHEVIRYCNDPSVRDEALGRFGTIGLVVGANLCASSLASITSTDKDDWQPGHGDAGEWHGAEICHVPTKVAAIPADQRVRYVAFRRGINGFGINHNELTGGHWDGVGSCRLRLLVTNHPSPEEQEQDQGATRSTEDNTVLPAKDMWEVRAEANARCGDSEQAHGIVKADFAGGILPSGKFGANSCWVFLACFSHNLVRFGRELMLAGTKWMRVRMKAFRAAFIYRSGKLVTHASSMVLKLPATGSGQLEEGWNKLFKLQA